jgi:integrase
VRVYDGTLTAFLGTLRPRMLIEHVEARHARAFYDRPGLSETSRNTYFRQLRTFFKWCVDAGLLRVSPVEGMKAPKASRKVVSYLTQGEYEKLCSAIQAHLVLEARQIQPGEVAWFLDLIRVAVGSGMRLGELCAMRWSWVNLAQGTITIKNGDGFTTKNGHERVVYISGEALATLPRRSEGRPEEGDVYVFPGVYGGKLNGNYVGKRFRFFRDLAKLPGHLHFHSLRHTYGSWLAQKGIDLYRIKELMGHTSMQTTMRYAHLQPKNLRDAVQLVFGTA